MPLPSVEQFIGTNVTEQGFKDAQKQLVEYVGNEVPKKIDTYTKAEVDTALSAVAAGHKAYQTLAAAQAAQATLPVNSVVEVTNDPTASNNGTYQWNGTTLTKSAYDPTTLANTYTDNKVKSVTNNIYDFHFDSLGIQKGKNLFDGVFHEGGFNTRLLIGGGIALRSIDYTYYKGTSNIAIIPVRPNQTYSIKIHEELTRNEVFRVAAFTYLPSPVPPNVALHEVDKKDMGTMLTNVGLSTSEPVDMGNYAVTVTTLPDTNYLLVMISDSGLQPKLQVEEGKQFTSYEKPSISYNNAGILKQSYEAFASSKGVNLFNGEYLWVTYFGNSSDVPRTLIQNHEGQKGVLAEVKVEKNTTYTISSPDPLLFNRFRVGLMYKRPYYVSTNSIAVDVELVNSSSYTEFTFTTDDQTEYVVVYLSFGTGTKPRLQVEKGSQASPYSEPSQDFKNLSSRLKTVQTHNLLDKNKAIPAEIVESDGGILTVSMLKGYPKTHLIAIPVSSNSVYTLSSDFPFVDTIKVYSFAENPLSLLDSKNTTVGKVTGTEITQFDVSNNNTRTFSTSTQTRIIVLQMGSGNLTSKLQFEKGRTVSEYKEPYVIASSMLETGNTSGNNVVIGKSTNLNNIRPFHILSDIDSLYVTENPIEDFFSDPMQPTSADIIQLYDDLVSEFPELITKEVLGQDQHGYDMVSYTTHPVPRYVSRVQGFNPSRTDNVVVKPPKIVITSGVHGLERVGVYANYYLIRDMLRGSDNDKALAYLKRNVQFVICPIVNRSGFDDFKYETRTNGNINRDFIQGAVSLPESIILKEFLDSHKDMDFYIDFHNSRAITSELGYVFTGEEVFGETSIQILQELGVVWQEREPRLDQDPRAIWGFYMETINGMVIGYVSEYLGVPSIIPETKYTLPKVDTGSHYNKDIVRLGKELMVNCIHMCLRESRRVNA